MTDHDADVRRLAIRGIAEIELLCFTPGQVDADGCLTWWQLSFTGDDGWLGGLLIEAPSLASAVMRSHAIGCNPGGEILAIGFRARSVPDGYADRLITDRAEVENMPSPDLVEVLSCG